MNGSAGNLTFREFSGRTVVSEKITSVSNSRTDAQLCQRMKWVNIIRMYSGISPMLNKGFEKKLQGQSDYNVFVMLNTSGCLSISQREKQTMGLASQHLTRLHAASCHR